MNIRLASRDDANILDLPGRRVSLAEMSFSGEVRYIRIESDGSVKAVIESDDDAMIVAGITMVDGEAVPSFGSLLWSFI